jgi:lipopolysaccharide export LptBFGC system permease protein LptF
MEKEIFEWFPFIYKGLETNIEATKDGRVRRVKKEGFYGEECNTKIGEIDFTNIKLVQGYKMIRVKVKTLETFKSVNVHQIVACIFLNHQINKNTFVVDHIDSNKLNNHVDNLRIITNRENVSKEKAIKKGLPTNIHLNKKTNRYQVHKRVEGKQKYLKSFILLSEAIEFLDNYCKSS